jgi:prepilin-type N-terminal cleavage/methylation domain-containing protein
MKYKFSNICHSCKSNKQGFTLVETLVAILALSLSLGALTVLASRSVTSSRAAESRVIAEFLAAEGIELAQKDITSRLIQSGGTSNPFGNISLCAMPLGCVVDSSDKGIKISSDTNYPTGRMAYDSALHIYKHSTAGESEFRRLIFVRNSNGLAAQSTDPRTIRSVVYYRIPGEAVERTITLTKEFQPWYIQ